MYKEVLFLDVKIKKWKQKCTPLSLEIGVLKYKDMSFSLEQSVGERQQENLVQVKYSLAEIGDKLSMNLKNMLTSTQYHCPNAQFIFKFHLNIWNIHSNIILPIVQIQM